MKRILVIIAIAISCAFLIVVFIQSQKQPKTISPLVSEEKKPVLTEKPAPLAKYESESGFSFDYPGDLQLDNSASQSDSTYAHVKLTSQEKPGSTEIEIIDTKETSVQKYATSNQIDLDGANPVSFAEIKGQQIETQAQIMTIAIDQGILFKITTDLGKDPKYWTAIHSDILSTFEFKETVQSNTATSSTQEDVTSQSDEVEFSEEEDLSE